MTRPCTIAAFLCVLVPTLSLAQAPGGGGAPPAAGGMRAGGGAVDPGQFRQKQLDAIKDKLQASEEQWNALGPRIEKVIDAKRDASTGAGMSFGAAAGPGAVFRATGGGNVEIGSSPGKAMQEVRAALEQKDTTDEEILKKLAAMREARDKAKADLAAVQKELKESCTPRQEAILVTLGVLE